MKPDDSLMEMEGSDLSPRLGHGCRQCRQCHVLRMSKPLPLIGISLQIAASELNFRNNVVSFRNANSSYDRLKNFTENYSFEFVTVFI
jgi:hypothetical protein